MMVGRRRSAWVTLVWGAGSAAIVLASASACSSSTSNGAAVVPGPGNDANAPAEDGGAVADAPAEAKADAPSSACEGACKTTSLVTDFGGRKRTLNRAQFGTQQGDAGAQLHTESHLGGSPACPSMQSPTPDYTLIVSSIPRGTAGGKLSERDGVTSAFFDFKSDLGLAAPSGITKAVSVSINITAQDTANPPAWIAMDVSAMFREGQVKGHMYAEYCQSLSQ
jgi:hypothetical protein